MENKLSEELKHCLDGNGCFQCVYSDEKAIMSCRKLLQNAYEKIKYFDDLEEQGLLLKLPCKIRDTVYVDSKTIPTENMDFEEVKDMPLYFKAIVVSFRKNSNGTYIKLKVKAKWLHEWIDPECGPDSSYYEVDKYFTYPLSAIGKTVFLMQAEAEEALKRMERGK